MFIFMQATCLFHQSGVPEGARQGPNRMLVAVEGACRPPPALQVGNTAVGQCPGSLTLPGDSWKAGLILTAWIRVGG